MNSPQFKRNFYGLLSVGFFLVTAREAYQSGFTRDAIITTIFGVAMAFLSYRARRAASTSEPQVAPPPPPPS